MIARGRDESGYTLIEVLLVSVLSIVVLGATLSVFTTMERKQQTSRKVNVLQDETRAVVDQIAKQLRNVASPSDNVFKPIERAEPHDLIFRVVSRTGTATATNPTNIQRVRYCLDNQRRLYTQTQVLTDASTAHPVGQACPLPGSGWSSQRLINGNVVNGTRPVFSYVMSSTSGYQELATVTADAELERVVSVRAQIFVDDNIASGPAESALGTRVFLRNQNIKPTASFIATPSGTMSLQLNGSASEDAEGGRLLFEWFDENVVATNKKVGEGAVFLYSPVVGSRSIYLKVTDPGGNFAVTPAQTFNCQTSTGCA